MGGQPAPFPANRNLDRVVSGPQHARLPQTDPGDPVFVADRYGANKKQIFIDKPGNHNHYPVWSPDGRFVYFARGITTPFDMDIWRIPPDGGAVERLTTTPAWSSPPSRRAHAALHRPRPDGSGSGLYAMDVDRRVPHAVSFGLEEYISVCSERRWATSRCDRGESDVAPLDCTDHE